MSYMGVDPGDLTPDEMYGREPIPGQPREDDGDAMPDEPFANHAEEIAWHLARQVECLTAVAVASQDWIDRMEASGVQHLRETKAERWPGGLDEKGDPILCRANDLAVFARIDARSHHQDRKP